jgi:hypothetical protein
MASYPVEAADTSGIVDAVNNLLSGPSGLGQDFGGFSSYQTAYITGNFRTPYSTTTPTSLYVPPVNLATASQPSGDTFAFTFASPLPTQPPFVQGQGVTISGVADSYYNDTYNTIGVASCTTTDLILRARGQFLPLQPPSTGGTARYDRTSPTGPVNPESTFVLSTDCNVKVVVTGGTDRVFVAAQLLNTISYVQTSTSDLVYTVAIDRYKGFPNEDVINPGFFFSFDERVAQQIQTFTGVTGTTGTLPLQNTIFGTLVDANIAPGYYWYLLNVDFYRTTGDIRVTTCELAQRSMTAQVVKQ